MARKLVVLSALVIVLVAFIAYYPAFKIGFFNGWWYLQWVGTMDLPRYLIQFLDPRNVTQGYRPVQGLYVLLQYSLFGFNPSGFQFTHTLLHALNAVLLFLIIGRVAQRWRVGLIAALLYAVSPVTSLAVFWHAVVDPLSAFFYFLTILLWTRYQETGRTIDWIATFTAFGFALFSKEVAVFLPVFLFLIERWFYHRRLPLTAIARIYAPFFLLLIPYGLLDLNVQSHGEFVGQFGFKIGPHMLFNLLPYMAVMTFPWIANAPRDLIFYVWMMFVALVFIVMMVIRRSRFLLFVALFAVLNIGPLLGFPLDYFNTRYLYNSLAVSVLLIALLLELAWRRLGRAQLVSLGIAAIVGAVVVLSSYQVAIAGADLAEFTRQIRVPFRDISRQHASFPPDTYVYFVYSPHTTLIDFQGMFFVRYGTEVKVDGTDTNQSPELRQHNSSFVYYFDSTGAPRELRVEKSVSTVAQTTLPARFSAPITLQSYQVASATLYAGRALVVMLEMQATAPIDKDYTIFAHLLDASGKTLSGYDGPPRRGAAPTSQWRNGQVVVDALVLPLSADVREGENLRLELGFYDPVTMERLGVLDAQERMISDTIIVAPFTVLPQE